MNSILKCDVTNLERNFIYLISNASETTSAINPETIAEEIIGSLFCIVGLSITRLIAENITFIIDYQILLAIAKLLSFVSNP